MNIIFFRPGVALNRDYFDTNWVDVMRCSHRCRCDVICSHCDGLFSDLAKVAPN